MKKTKKALAVLLTVMIVVGAVSAVGADMVFFTDTEGHWAWTGGYIPYLVEKNVLNGYPKSDGTYYFKPDGEVTRAEFIKMLDETFGLTETKTITYSDVKPSDWFYVYFQKAAAQGYILNYGLTCNPDGKLTREEAITLLTRYLDLPDDEKASSAIFSDYRQVSLKYREYVLEAAGAGLIEGYKQNDGTYEFRPSNTLTRAEALTILYRAAGCIYNTDSQDRDAGASAENSVITKPVIIENQALSGRTIISEGVDKGTVMFSNCTIDGQLYIKGKANVSFVNCKVGEIHIVNKANLSILNESEISEINVGNNAGGAMITGDGKISYISVKPSGFSSTIMPDGFEIQNGVKASLGGKICTGIGTNDSDGVYSVETPFAVLKYPEKWKNRVTTSIDGNTASFMAGENRLFDLIFDTEREEYLGVFEANGIQHRVYIEKYHASESDAELEEMANAVDVILEYLEKDYGFVFVEAE